MGRSGRALSCFDLFECQATIAAEGARELHVALHADEPARGGAERLRLLQEDAGLVAERCFEELHRPEGLPFDPDAAERLATGLEEVLESLTEAAARVELYRPVPALLEAAEAARMLGEALAVTEDAIDGMRNLRHGRRVLAQCDLIVDLARDAGHTVRLARARLFREVQDPVGIVKWTDVLAHLDAAATRCRTVARLIEEVMIGALS